MTKEPAKPIGLNLSKLAKRKAPSVSKKLNDLFGQLDRKQSHESLRPSQIETLDLLDIQLAEHDVVLKLGTGAGKTVVGLIYAEYMRRKYAGEPVVYVCPTNQLVEQVLQTAVNVGIPAEEFPSGGMPYAALEGKAVLVCNYDHVFNGKTVFLTRNIRPSAYVLDDVHAGIERVRSAYTAIPPSAALKKVKDLLREGCSKIEAGLWRGIENSESDARLEIPFWMHQPNAAAIAAILDNHKDEDRFKFPWPNVSRYLEYERLCITGTGSEVSCYTLPIEENKSFAEAKHRLMMSASIKDGGFLIRDFGCDPDALKRVVEPASDRGVGERMVIPVSLVDSSIKKEGIAKLCNTLKKGANIVVLVSAKKQASVWENYGATFVEGDGVDIAVTRLRTSKKGNLFVFAQRFDGIDLPDDACRVLVIDGTPSGDRISDAIDGIRQRNSPGYNIRVVNRFEQALGRAVRSSADYAAVLLVGNDLASFVGRKDVKDLLEPNTREQIDLGKDVAEQLSESDDGLEGIRSAIDIVLSRDEEWKEAHRERVGNVAKQVRKVGELTQNEVIAVAERRAWLMAKARNHQAAVTALQEVGDRGDLQNTQKAELLYRIASYMNFFDQGRALAVHRAAFELNSSLPRPVQLPDRKYSRVGEQIGNLKHELGEFTNPNAAIARIEELKALLAYAGSAEQVEAALQQLGALLGAVSSRPEKETGRGPDVLWQFPELSFCIEAKSDKTAPIYKADAEQLLLSVEWCEKQTGISRANIIPVFATNSLKVDRAEDISFGPYFLEEGVAVMLAENLKAVIGGVSFDGPLFLNSGKLTDLINQEKLSSKAIRARLKRK